MFRVSLLLLVLFGPLLAGVGLISLLPATGEALGKMVLLFSLVWLLSALLLSPALLFPPREPPPDPPGDGGGGGGGGDGPPGPTVGPSAPSGGIPLPDAEQSRDRVRDHDRPDRRRRRPRRPAREPERVPPARVTDPQR